MAYVEKSFKVLDIKVKYNIADAPRVRILNPHQTNVSGGTKDVGGGQIKLYSCFEFIYVQCTYLGMIHPTNVKFQGEFVL